MRAYFVLLILASAASSAQPYTFRGISQSLTCEEARAKEAALGSVFVREDTPNASEPLYKHYLFNGTLYDAPVEIRLGCLTLQGSGRQILYDGFYTFHSRESVPANAFLDRIIRELKPTFGAPRETPDVWNKPDGTSTVIGKRVLFACVNDAHSGYALMALLRNPVQAQSDYQVWLNIRYVGGPC